ncbi:hypothetical protein [Methylobacterium sp. E-045]|uniref:hypothetical protein n=1 Tax=Methylobacterium sp. E-045 TaxID=2836575 RepID=UPI001FBB912E|nr:hypothetical protein [Methylobacterium sp. E-045]MCJ2131393.1 hypothetical protein [Methylobacterium sp. E-045]
MPRRLFRTRVRAWLSSLKGWRTYLVAFVLALPEILEGLGAVDFSAVLPAAIASKVGLILLVARLVLAPYLRTLAAAKAPAAEEPR